MRKILTIVFLVLLFSSCSAYNASTEEGRKAFLASYGWEVSGDSTQQVELTIPKVLDKVYEGYNDLQKEAGMDLSPYKGKRAMRYTYIITNYPRYENSEIRANLLVCDGKIIAGDIMSPSVYGFMLPINTQRESFMK